MLKSYRKKAGLTQQEVADICEMERAYYAMIELGYRKPSVKVAKKIGKALDFDWTEFYEECEV